MENTEVVTGFLAAAGIESWVIQIFIIVLVTAAVTFAMRRLFERLHRALERTPTVWDQSLFGAIRKPMRALVWVIGLTYAVEIASKENEVALFDAIEPVRDVAVIAILVWFLVRFIRIAETTLIAESEGKEDPIDPTTVDAIAKLLRLSVIITGALVALQTLGFSISGVLAFGGIGGIAVGFAAKDLLANFFGGLMIYLDRPFTVGDWIRSPDREIEGVVEKIGWRLCVIRCFDSRPLYIPNSAFTTMAVQNPSRMRNRDIWETFGIRYQDGDKMDAITRDVKQMLLDHPEIDTTKTLMVSFNKFAPSSLDFFVYCFTRTTRWVHFHDVKQEILLKILEIIHQHGADVAFPTRTVEVSSLPPAEPPDPPGSHPQ